VDDEQQQVIPDAVANRLARIEDHLADFHRRSAHRESIIDRLHAENQEFREGLRRVILEPVVTDLLRLYNSMAREAHRLATAEPSTGRLLNSYADEIEQAVERCGYQLVTASAGEAYQVGRHIPAGTLATNDPALDNTVADALTTGLVEMETGQVRRPARAHFYRYEQPVAGAPDFPASAVDPSTHPAPVGGE
jgi:hypothetical protein